MRDWVLNRAAEERRSMNSVMIEAVRSLQKSQAIGHKEALDELGIALSSYVATIINHVICFNTGCRKEVVTECSIIEFTADCLVPGTNKEMSLSLKDGQWSLYVAAVSLNNWGDPPALPGWQ